MISPSIIPNKSNPLFESFNLNPPPRQTFNYKAFVRHFQLHIHILINIWGPQRDSEDLLATGTGALCFQTTHFIRSSIPGCLACLILKLISLLSSNKHRQLIMHSVWFVPDELLLRMHSDITNGDSVYLKEIIDGRVDYS